MLPMSLLFLLPIIAIKVVILLPHSLATPPPPQGLSDAATHLREALEHLFVHCPRGDGVDGTHHHSPLCMEVDVVKHNGLCPRIQPG